MGRGVSSLDVGRGLDLDFETCGAAVLTLYSALYSDVRGRCCSGELSHGVCVFSMALMMPCLCVKMAAVLLWSGGRWGNTGDDVCSEPLP